MSRKHALSQRKAILVETATATEPELPADAATDELVPSADAVLAEAEDLEPAPPADAAEEPAAQAPTQLQLDPPRRAASLLVPTGIMTFVAGVAVCALAATGASPVLVDFLAKCHFAPGLVVALGCVFVGLGMLGKRTESFAEHEALQSRRAFEHIAAEVGDTLAYQRSVAERPPQNEAEVLERAMLSMQRQDEKLNNLSKALKMYGKPLMEISQQTGEISQVCGDIASTVTAFKLYTEQTGGRTDAQLKGQLEAFESKLAPQGKALAEVTATCKGLSESLQAVRKEIAEHGRKGDDPLAKKLEELGKGLAALTQRVEGLAGSAAPARDDGTFLKALEARLDGLRDTLLQQVRRELGGLQTQIARVAQAPTPATTPLAPQGAVATPAQDAPPTGSPTAAAAAPVPAHPALPEPVGAAAPAGLAHAIAGEKRTDSKNVLGAIAKLKSLRK